jgi:hypothetical protein
MPICYITISDSINKSYVIGKINEIRDIVAEGLESKSRLLDRNHIAVRIVKSKRQFMLGELEIDVFAQFFWRRYFSRDKRANFISLKVTHLLGYDCATWINLCQVGYSRVTKYGESFFSVKADDEKIREKRETKKRHSL